MAYESIRRVIALIGIFAALCSCVSNAERHPAQWLVVSLGGEPVTLNAVTSSDAYASQIFAYTHNGLTTVDANLRVIPDLALRWTVSKDNRVYTFHLRDDVFWHDGAPFCAEDVRYTYEQIMDPSSKAFNKRDSFTDVTNFEIVDRHTVRIYYSAPRVNIELDWATPMIPEHIYNHLDEHLLPGERARYAPTLHLVLDDAFYARMEKERAALWNELEAAWSAACDAQGAKADDAPRIVEAANESHSIFERAITREGEGGSALDGTMREALTGALNDARLNDAGAMRYVKKIAADITLTSPSFVNNRFNRSPVGTGPYRFANWKSRQTIEVEKVEGHFRDNPAIERVRFLIVLDPTVELNIYKQGGLDYVGMTAEQWVKETNSPAITDVSTLFVYERLSLNYIGWNMNGENPFFADKRVRQAMTYACPRQEYVETALHGLARVAAGPIHPDLREYHTGLVPYPTDLAAAAALLTEAGWVDEDRNGVREKMIDGKKVEFSFELLSGEGSGPMMNLFLQMQENLQKIGVIMHIHQLEWKAYINRVHEKDFTACALGWSLGLDPNPADLFHSRQIATGLNYFSYSNAVVDTLSDRARTEFDAEKRNALFFRIQDILAEEQPYTFLTIPKALVAVNKRFGNIQPPASGLNGFYPGVLGWTIETALEAE